MAQANGQIFTADHWKTVLGFSSKRRTQQSVFRSYESSIKSAPHQGFGERRGVITRQADFDARKLVSKDAVHLGQQTDFNPRQKAKGECRSRRLSCAQRCFLCCLCLKQRHSRVFEKRFAGRRQFNAVCATVHQLNANLLFEISDLPTDGWLRSVELLLRAATVKLPASATATK
jgi:hypothetical protein